MEAGYTAILQQRDEWWVGWVEEVPGVNSQASSREELLSDLRSALAEALEMAAPMPSPQRKVLPTRNCD